jgi:hypothetical protein
MELHLGRVQAVRDEAKRLQRGPVGSKVNWFTE